MGHACPVCETPQADGEHLANHLAITAMLHGDDHADWLDEHAPGWEESSPDELAERVVEFVPETEFPQVFDDTASEHQHAHGREGERSAGRFDGDGGDLPFEAELARQAGGRGRGDLTAEQRDVIAEARELTERMMADDSEDSGSPPESDADGDDATDRNDNE